MNNFNKNSRTSNVLMTFFVSIGSNLFYTLFAFFYRTVFLHILSATYLGINGLFTNILQILSLADLGIMSAISFRLYDPISKKDVNKVGKIIKFFKSIYILIAIFITLVGFCLLPFLQFLIKDPDSIPKELNLQIIFLLFLFQCVSSYVCSYKQILLSADQKQYILSFLVSLMKSLNYGVQIVVLLLTHNFTLSLIASIICNIVINMCISIWITKQYQGVFQVKESLSCKEKYLILMDTKATMCHKIGGTIISSTDNIILSKFISITVTGLYSTYSLIISSLNTIIIQLLGNFTSSFGNAHIELSENQNYNSYKRMLFFNYWIASLVSVCLYLLIDDFIIVWLGEEMLLDSLTVIALSIQFYLEAIRQINISYINACGLFVKDKIRPLIESSLNLILSIIFVQKFGIVGVFLGTIISKLVTVFWREPYLLYKFEFMHYNVADYWKMLFKFSITTIVFCSIVNFVKSLISYNIPSFFILVIEAFLIFIMFNVFLIILFFHNPDFKFFYNFLINKLRIHKKR